MLLPAVLGGGAIVTAASLLFCAGLRGVRGEEVFRVEDLIGDFCDFDDGFEGGLRTTLLLEELRGRFVGLVTAGMGAWLIIEVVESWKPSSLKI